MKENLYVADCNEHNRKCDANSRDEERVGEVSGPVPNATQCLPVIPVRAV